MKYALFIMLPAAKRLILREIKIGPARRTGAKGQGTGGAESDWRRWDVPAVKRQFQSETALEMPHKRAYSASRLKCRRALLAAIKKTASPKEEAVFFNSIAVIRTFAGAFRLR